MEWLRYFVVLCLSIYTEAKSLHYDYEYDEDAKVWFKLHRIKASWHEARKMCNIEGAVLASPLNKQIRDALDAYPRAYNIDEIFVGIHATFSENFWHTIEGVPLEKLIDDVDVNKFGLGSGSCSVWKAGSLKSVRCSEEFPYMCYKRENPDMQLTSCGTTDKEYVFHEETGNCYKFHAQHRTWRESFKICAAEEAYLAIINSEVEGQLLKNIFDKYPDSVLSQKTYVIGLGIVDWEHNGEWYTIHGERLEDAGYCSWNKGEPNNARGDEFCGSMLRNGFLNDEPCSFKSVFICEKDVRNLNGSEHTTEAKYLTATEETTVSSTITEEYRESSTLIEGYTESSKTENTSVFSIDPYQTSETDDIKALNEYLEQIKDIPESLDYDPFLDS